METPNTTAETLIPILKNLGFIEVSNDYLRRFDCREVIEYLTEGKWRTFARR